MADPTCEQILEQLQATQTQLDNLQTEINILEEQRAVIQNLINSEHGWIIHINM